MAIWFQIALVLNLIYWTVFFYLVSRRRWPGLWLAGGIFNMFFASHGRSHPSARYSIQITSDTWVQ